MEQTSKYAVTANYVMRKIADESILVPVSPQLKNRDCLFVLNSTGYVIYSGLRAGQTPAQLEQQILDEFDGASLAQIRTEMDTLIHQMIEIEALRESP